MSQNAVTCACGERFTPTAKRPHTCRECYWRAWRRAWRKRHYHEVVKKNPLMLAAHRETSRQAEARYRQAHPDRARNSKRKYEAKQRTPELRLTSTEGQWELCL